MKRLIIFVFTLLMIVSCGCAKNNETVKDEPVKSEEPSVEADTDRRSDWTFDDSIDASPVIIEGICLERKVNEYFSDYDLSIRVEKVYRGEASEGEIVSVSVTPSDVIKADGRYIIMAKKLASVYSNRPLYYSAVEIIAVNDDGSLSCPISELNGKNYTEAANMIENRIKEHPFDGDDAIIGAYITSEDINEILRGSDHAIVVLVDGVEVDGGDRTCYKCTVKESLKGDLSGQITVAYFKNGMEIGEEYVVLVNHSGVNDLYILSSVKSGAKIGTVEADEILDACRQ